MTPDGAHRQQHGEGLPDRVVEAGLADFVEVDCVRLAQDVDLLPASRRPGCGWRGRGQGTGGGRRRPPAGRARRPSARTSSLKSSRNGSTSFIRIRSGRPADVVVALDRDRGSAGEGDALDHVRIERALRQELDRPLAVAGDSARLGVEHLDEQPADGLALGLRVVDARPARSGIPPTHRHGPAECCSGRERGPPPRPPRPARIRPGSTKTQVSWSPIASWISTAATERSTPPERPQITRPLPT